MNTPRWVLWTDWNLHGEPERLGCVVATIDNDPCTRELVVVSVYDEDDDPEQWEYAAYVIGARNRPKPLPNYPTDDGNMEVFLALEMAVTRSPSFI